MRKVSLTPAAAVATLTLNENGSGGTAILDMQAAASGTSAFSDLSDHGEGGLVYSGQLYAIIGGAGALVTVCL